MYYMNMSDKGDKTLMEAIFLEYTPILFKTIFPQSHGSLRDKIQALISW